jgi:AcrR family transcriptional regulator
MKRPGGRSARVKAAVLEAALEQLAEGGYEAFSFEAVAQRAGVHKTTLYRRWSSRENLLLDAMLERGTERVPIPDTGSLEQDLLEYARRIVASITPEIEAAIRAIVSIGDRAPAVAEAGRRFWATRFELAGEIVARAIDRGELAPGTDPIAIVEAVIAPIYFRVLLSGAPRDEHFLRTVARSSAAARSASRPAPPSRATARRSPPAEPGG